MSSNCLMLMSETNPYVSKFWTSIWCPDLVKPCWIWTQSRNGISWAKTQSPYIHSKSLRHWQLTTNIKKWCFFLQRIQLECSKLWLRQKHQTLHLLWFWQWDLDLKLWLRLKWSNTWELLLFNFLNPCNLCKLCNFDTFHFWQWDWEFKLRLRLKWSDFDNEVET